jgi:tetratricopeptide (TPR) repeat protein
MFHMTEQTAVAEATQAKMSDIRGRLSALWIVIMFNMVYADILSFLNPEFLRQLMTGYAGKQASAWLEAERANLHAAASYAAASARPMPAMLIPAAMTGFLGVQHHWDQALTLHQTALAAARQAGDRPGQGRALNLLSTAQIEASDLAAAETTLQQPLALHRDLGDHGGQADALNGLGTVYWLTDDYRAAGASHQQALQLFREIGQQLGQAQALNGLGAIWCMTGDYPAAEASHRQALELFRILGHRHGRARGRRPGAARLPGHRHRGQPQAAPPRGASHGAAGAQRPDGHGCEGSLAHAR